MTRVERTEPAQVGEQTNRSLFSLTVINLLGLAITVCTGQFG